MSLTSPYAAALAKLPTARQSLEIAGSESVYWEYGTPDLPLLILVHGFRGDHHGLEPIVAGLEGYRVIAPDLPGFGESEPFAARTHDVGNYSWWLREFAAQVAPGEPVVIGHSFGSIIVAAAVADGMPASKTVLINPIGAPALEGPRGILTRLAVLYYRVGAALPARAGNALLRSRLIVRGLSEIMAKTKDPELRSWIHDQHDRYFSAYSNRQVVLEAFRASVSNDVTEFAAKIEVPTLLIGADLDDITPPSAQHRLVTLLPDAELIMLPETGHLMHYEAPRQAAAQIETFLTARR